MMTIKIKYKERTGILRNANTDPNGGSEMFVNKKECAGNKYYLYMRPLPFWQNCCMAMFEFN